MLSLSNITESQVAPKSASFTRSHSGNLERRVEIGYMVGAVNVSDNHPRLKSSSDTSSRAIASPFALAESASPRFSSGAAEFHMCPTAVTSKTCAAGKQRPTVNSKFHQTLPLAHESHSTLSTKTVRPSTTVSHRPALVLTGIRAGVAASFGVRGNIASTHGVNTVVTDFVCAPLTTPSVADDIKTIDNIHKCTSGNNDTLNLSNRHIHSVRGHQTCAASVRLPVSSVALVGSSADRVNPMRFDFASSNTTVTIPSADLRSALRQLRSSEVDSGCSNHCPSATVPDSRSTSSTTGLALSPHACTFPPTDISNSLIADIHHTSFASHPSQHARFSEHLFQLQLSAAQSLNVAQQHSSDQDAALSKLRSAHAEEMAALQRKLAEISADIDDGDIASAANQIVFATEDSDFERQNPNTTLGLLESSRHCQTDTASLHISSPVPTTISSSATQRLGNTILLSKGIPIHSRNVQANSALQALSVTPQSQYPWAAAASSLTNRPLGMSRARGLLREVCLQKGILVAPIDKAALGQGKNGLFETLTNVRPTIVAWKQGTSAWLKVHGKDQLIKAELSKAKLMELRQLYDLLDADGGGTIQAEEIAAALIACGIRVTDKMLANLFAQSGKNVEDELTFIEFAEMMTGGSSDMIEGDSSTHADAADGDTSDGAENQNSGGSGSITFALMTIAFRRKKMMEENEEALHANLDVDTMLRIAQSFKELKKTEHKTTNRFEEKDTFEVALDRLIAALSASSLRSQQAVYSPSSGGRRSSSSATFRQ